VGAFEALKFLGTNILNSAQVYSRGPTTRGFQFEEAAGANLGKWFPRFDYWDSNTGTAIQIRSTTQTQSMEALLSVVRRGVDKMDDLPPQLRGKDRNGAELTINSTDIRERGLLVGIPAKPLPWLGQFLGRVREIAESERVTIAVQYVEGLEGPIEEIEK